MPRLEVELDFSNLTAHQTKTLEMEAQVHLLKLESEVGRLSPGKWRGFALAHLKTIIR